MNKKLKFIFERRSVRAYEEKPVPDDLVHDLLEAAMAAPTSGGKTPWRFVVVRDKGTLARTAAGLANGRALEKAAVGIVVCGDPRAGESHLSHLLQDCSAAIENILLAVTALGLGACWLGVHPEEELMSNVRSVLGVPQDIVPVAVIAVGWPGERREPRTQYSDAFVHHERW